MRFLYKIALGIILFQAFLIVITPFFPYTGIDENAKNITNDAEFTKYSNLDSPTGLLQILIDKGGIWGGLVGIIISVAGLGGALITKNYVFIGVGIFLGFLSSFFVMTTTFLMSLSMNLGNNSGVNSVVSVFSICLGLLCLFAVVDMFAPSGAVE